MTRSLRDRLPPRVRRAAIAGRHAWRVRTSPLRAMPGLLILGAMKAGTSSLYHYLSQHPQIVGSLKKEVGYFDGGPHADVDNFARGDLWYRSHFPLAARLGRDRVTLEATPRYLYCPAAPSRIAQRLPGVRLVALLRDPAERAISHYFHERRKGREPLPMMDAFLAEEARLAPATRAREYQDFAFVHYSYKARGRYREQLDRYHACFPAEQLLVLSAEELFEDPASTLRRVFEHVGVDPGVRIPDLSARNVAANRSDVPPEVEAHLRDHFAPHNAALYELLGRDLGW